ncbi:5141_t:CDS:2, partial [Acaulospora colombiana]
YAFKKNMPNSSINVNDELRSQELQSLRLLRASLTSLDILTKQMLKDLEILTRNYEVINATCEGWKVILPINILKTDITDERNENNGGDYMEIL